MKIPRIIFQQTGAEQINTGGFLLLLSVVVFLSFNISLWHAQWFSEKQIDQGIVQEQLGDRIQVLGRYDQDHKATIRQQWDGMVQHVQWFWMQQPARLQETLGMAITSAGRNIWMEENRLRASIQSTSAKLERFDREKAARWQERLGTAVLAAYRRAPTGGIEFQIAFERETVRQRTIEARTARGLKFALANLKSQEVALRGAVPGMLHEAVESAHRSARIYDASIMAWSRNVLTELNAALSWKRQPEDYVQIAGAVRDHFVGFRGVGGFMEYGWASLIGLLSSMVWLGLTISGDSLVDMGTPVKKKPIVEHRLPMAA